MTFARTANHPLRPDDTATFDPKDPYRPKTSVVEQAVLPSTFQGMPAGGTTTEVVSKEERQ